MERADITDEDDEALLPDTFTKKREERAKYIYGLSRIRTGDLRCVRAMS
jgi:hypothetical protein